MKRFKAICLVRGTGPTPRPATFPIPETQPGQLRSMTLEEAAKAGAEAARHLRQALLNKSPVICLAFVLFVLFCWSTSAATVTGTNRNANGQAAASQVITFTPRSTPLVNDAGELVNSSVIKTNLSTNGTFSVWLETGYYDAATTWTRDLIRLYVPNDSSTNDWLNLRTNVLTLSSNAPRLLTGVAQGTNGILTVTNASGVVTIHFTGSSGGGSGDVSTANLLYCSNALVSIMSLYDTQTSNGLYSLIIGGGITAATATNISQYFATNTSIITSNTLWSYMSGLSNTLVTATNDAFAYARGTTNGLAAYIAGVSNNVTAVSNALINLHGPQIAGLSNDLVAASNFVVSSHGTARVTNNAVVGGRLMLGGETSSQAAIKNSSTQLQARLADDSNYASFQAANLVAHNGGGQKASIGAGGAGNLWVTSDGRVIWATATALSSGSGTASVGLYLHGAGTNGLGTSTTTPAGSLLLSNLHLLGRLTIPANNATSNYVWTCTNSTTGEGEWRVNPGASGGEANVNGEISLTNAAVFGWVYGKSGVSNLLRSLRPGYGLVGTNESTNIVLAVDSSVIAPVSLVTAASNGAVSFTMAASNTVYNYAAGHQTGSFTLSNLLAMGITNIVAGTNMYVQTNGGVLVLNSTATGGGGGGTITQAMEVTIDGGGGPIPTGVAHYKPVPSSCTIVGWDIIAADGNTGSIVLDVWKKAYSSFPPTVSDSIAGSEKPTITSSTKGQDTSLSTWTTACTIDDWLAVNVDSVTTLTKVVLRLRYTAP